MSDEKKSGEQKQWDYTDQAQYYIFRPNYAPEGIDILCSYVQAKRETSYTVADIGAGTANLTLMLLERGLHCIAVEPTRAMMDIGMERTSGKNVTWKVGTGENTTLQGNSVDWFTMGSSFNTTDRLATLQEAHRVLKPGGFFTCMWNHREIKDDPIQNRIEEIIKEVVPAYEPGVRREGQADVILMSKLFNDVHYIEAPQEVRRTFEEYIKAWRSVKNKYWDFETEEGKNTFETIVGKIEKEFGADMIFPMTYVTRIWTARRVDG